jgi:hypothetical protein
MALNVLDPPIFFAVDPPSPMFWTDRRIYARPTFLLISGGGIDLLAEKLTSQKTLPTYSNISTQTFKVATVEPQLLRRN